MSTLYWLPRSPDWGTALSQATGAADLVRLASFDLDLLQTVKLDRRVRALPEKDGVSLPRVKLAILSSTTTEHLAPALRVAGIRHGLCFDLHVTDIGQYEQALGDRGSDLCQFHPDAVLLSFDAEHLIGPDPAMDAADADQRLQSAIRRIERTWAEVRQRFTCQILQQTVLATGLSAIGGNDHRLAWSRVRMIARINDHIHNSAESAGVDVLDIGSWSERVGRDRLHDPALWRRAKQEITPAAAPLYGDLVARSIAAGRGHSAKCLVLDLDNTLWGGVIGDDGVNGIVLGPGSAEGEAFAHFQSYAKSLTRQGVLLAVCSKNDLANVMEVFEKHPEMVLRTPDIAAFRVNWTDKATNLREIARELNIGLDALAFVDDNPFERSIVRSELPMVRTLELPDEPALFAQCVADSGAFDLTHVTAEDRKRSELYVLRREEQAAMSEQTDLAGYLASLDMTLHWSHFRPVDLQRVTQLANKTNQFNLRTRRYTPSEVEQCLQDPGTLTLQFRLTDRLADHGIISILIGRLETPSTLFIETWLMSCRVIGRNVEDAILAVARQEAVRLGARTLVGEYLPSPKNQMVCDLYNRLGFSPADAVGEGQRWTLDLTLAAPSEGTAGTIGIEHAG